MNKSECTEVVAQFSRLCALNMEREREERATQRLLRPTNMLYQDSVSDAQSPLCRLRELNRCSTGSNEELCFLERQISLLFALQKLPHALL